MDLGEVVWARSVSDPSDVSPVEALDAWGLGVGHPRTGEVFTMTSDGTTIGCGSLAEAWERVVDGSEHLVLWGGDDAGAVVSVDDGHVRINLNGMRWSDAVGAVHTVVGAATTDPSTVVVVADRRLTQRAELWLDYVVGGTGLPYEPDLLFQPDEGGSGTYRLRLGLDSWLNHPLAAAR